MILQQNFSTFLLNDKEKLTNLSSMWNIQMFFLIINSNAKKMGPVIGDLNNLSTKLDLMDIN